jgi:hypothetical protein
MLNWVPRQLCLCVTSSYRNVTHSDYKMGGVGGAKREMLAVMSSISVKQKKNYFEDVTRT